MKVFVNLTLISGETDPRKITPEDVFDVVKTTHDESQLNESYLYEPANEEEIECVFGHSHPEEIKETAKSWNLRITEEFDAALNALLAEKDVCGEWPLDNQITYRLRVAAMALDNIFYDYADSLVLFGKFYFSSR